MNLQTPEDLSQKSVTSGNVSSKLRPIFALIDRNPSDAYTSAIDTLRQVAFELMAVLPTVDHFRAEVQIRIGSSTKDGQQFLIEVQIKDVTIFSILDVKLVTDGFPATFTFVDDVPVVSNSSDEFLTNLTTLFSRADVQDRLRSMSQALLYQF